MRTCVFVDGENLRHSINELFGGFGGSFDQKDYLPKEANWAALYDDIVERATEGMGTRLRTYWYVVEGVDPQPRKVPELGSEQLVNLAWKNEYLKQSLNINTRESLTNQEGKCRDWLVKSSENIRKRFDGFKVLQDGIQRKHKAVEFRRSGTIGFDLSNGQFGNEKTVDVNLAVDLVLLREIYDVAIIVSGDQDYVPAVKSVKNFGKQVVNVSFLGRNGMLLPGGARRLNEATDWSVEYNYNDLEKFLSLTQCHGA